MEFCFRSWLFRLRVCLLIGVVVIAACGTGPWLPQQIELTQAQLQTLIQRKFPVSKSLLNPLARVDVRLSHPILSLDQHSQRIRLEVRVGMMVDTDALSRSGKIVTSGQLAYDPSRNALILRAPALEQFEMEGVPPGILPMLGKIWLHEATEMALYTLNEEQIKQVGDGLDKVTITLLSDRVVIKR